MKIFISILILLNVLSISAQDMITTKNRDTDLFCKIISIDKKEIQYQLLNQDDTTHLTIRKKDIISYKYNSIQEYNSYLYLQQRFINKTATDRIDEILIKKGKKYYVANILSVENDSVFFRKYRTNEVIGLPKKKVVEVRYDITNEKSIYYFVDSLDISLYHFGFNKTKMYKNLYNNWPIDSILSIFRTSAGVTNSDNHLFVSNKKRNFNLRNNRKHYLILQTDFTKIKLCNRIHELTDTSIIVIYKDIYYNIPFKQIETIGLESTGREILRYSLFTSSLITTYGAAIFLRRRWYRPLDLTNNWKITNVKLRE